MKTESERQREWWREDDADDDDDKDRIIGDADEGEDADDFANDEEDGGDDIGDVHVDDVDSDGIDDRWIWILIWEYEGEDEDVDKVMTVKTMISMLTHTVTATKKNRLQPNVDQFMAKMGRKSQGPQLLQLKPRKRQPVIFSAARRGKGPSDSSTCLMLHKILKTPC